MYQSILLSSTFSLAETLQKIYNDLAQIMMVFIKWLAFPENFITNALGYEFAGGNVNIFEAGLETGGGIWSIASSGTGVVIAATLKICKSYGIALSTVFLAIAIFEEATEEIRNVQRLLKPAINYMISIVLIIFSDQLLISIFKIGAELSSELNNEINYEFGIIEAASAGNGFLAEFMTVIAIAVGIMTLVLCILNIFVPLTVRLLEIIVRFVFSPIAIGLMPSSGLRGPAGRYLKKYAAVVLQGVGYLILTIAFYAIISTITYEGFLNEVSDTLGGNVFTDFFSMILSMIFSLGTTFALRTGIAKVPEICNDIMGA